TPNGQSSGVLQYDMGTDELAAFVRKGFLNSPPLVVRTAVSTLRAQHATVNRYTHFSDYVQLTKNRNLPPEFAYPTGTLDQLFEADYLHVAKAKTCATCDPAKLVHRAPRDTRP